jgi:hypothetical protein
VYDAIAPQPLAAKRPLAVTAGIALIIAPGSTGAAGRLTLELDGAAETSCANPALESLRAGNPALRALPLLELIAAGRAGTVTVRGTGNLFVSLRYAP